MPSVLLSYILMVFLFSVLFPSDVHSTGNWHRPRSQYFTDSFLPHSHSTLQSCSYYPLRCAVHTHNATHYTVTRLDTLPLSTCLICHLLHFSNALLSSSGSFSRSVCPYPRPEGTGIQSSLDVRGFACHHATGRCCFLLHYFDWFDRASLQKYCPIRIIS